MDEEKAIHSFLGERPDSAQLRAWRETLEQRLRRLREEREGLGSPAREQMAMRIAELGQQIRALRDEETVTRFVEDSVRVTLAMGSAVEGELEDLE